MKTLSYFKKCYFAIGIIVMFFGGVSAQYENTLQMDSLTPSPAASLSQLEWIVGNWEGEAFGGKTNEVWTKAAGASMMGMFKAYNENGVSFYELMTISEMGNSLTLKIKHFGADMKGWEAKDEYMEFKLIKLEGNRAYFNGLTFENTSDTQMTIYVIIDHDGENPREVKFPYQRAEL